MRRMTSESLAENKHSYVQPNDDDYFQLAHFNGRKLEIVLVRDDAESFNVNVMKLEIVFMNVPMSISGNWR